MRRPTREEDHGGQSGGRRQNRVFERAKAEDTSPRLARIQAGCFECLPIDDEAAADHERAKACGHDRTGAS